MVMVHEVVKLMLKAIGKQAYGQETLVEQRVFENPEQRMDVILRRPGGSPDFYIDVTTVNPFGKVMQEQPGKRPTSPFFDFAFDTRGAERKWELHGERTPADRRMAGELVGAQRYNPNSGTPKRI
jgi:hypothetical protein